MKKQKRKMKRKRNHLHAHVELVFDPLPVPPPEAALGQALQEQSARPDHEAASPAATEVALRSLLSEDRSTNPEA